MGECRGTESSPPGFFMKSLTISYRRAFIIAAVCVSAIGSVLFFLVRPCLFVEADGRLLSWFFVSREPEAFSLRFIHSVEKTPVVEKYKLDKQNNLIMYATEYESFGVGLPFLAAEGNFYAKGNRFIMEMNRSFPSVGLRTGPEAQLTLTVNKRQFQLYQMLPPGTMIHLSAGSWLARLTGSFSIY